MSQSNEATIYGLRSCKYKKVYKYINSQTEYKAYCYPNVPFKHVAHHVDVKSGILNVIMENCHRANKNQSLVRLIFCVGIKDADTDVALNASQVPSGKGAGNITNAELRLLYKLYSDYGPEVRVVMEKSVVFVHLHENKHKPNDYKLKVVPPIWHHANWQNTWELRKRSHYEDCAQKRDWALFFNPYIKRATLRNTEPRKKRLKRISDI